MQNELRAKGFSGFITFQELIKDRTLIPSQNGVYIVLRENMEKPHFMPKGTGGFFKQKDPNIAIAELEKKWVDNSSILYIGKAGGENNRATLKSRIEQYIKFGQGKPIGHKGGRYIWQLADAYSLIVCWKTLSEEDPREVESQMIQEFKKEHEGKRPFANLKD